MKRLTRDELAACFPHGQYTAMLPNQEEALEVIASEDGNATLEMPTGSGKTAVGFTFLKALAQRGAGPLFYTAPTKTLVEQVKALHPEVTVAYGRGEHECLYYGEGQDIRADEVPCSLLTSCPHRVNQQTGETFTPGAVPCPYLQAKYEAKKADIVVSTTAFYLFTQFFTREWEQPAGLVIDEAHKLARTIRGLLSYEITDWHLGRAVELLREIGAAEADTLERFLKAMIRIVRRKPSQTQALLSAEEIRSLIMILDEIDPKVLLGRISEAIASGLIDTTEKREVLRKIEVIVRDLRRYVRSLEYALPGEHHNALNYVYAYYRAEKQEGERVQYKLCIKAYYVVPIVKRILGERTVAYSATIGDAEVFQFENGISNPVSMLGSDFPPEHVRIFMPKDTPNLAFNAQSHGDLSRTLRKIARACVEFAEAGIRSLVLVVSDAEREKFINIATEEQLDVVSYGEGIAPREAVAAFKGGFGSTLVGTIANYGEGIDLPRQMAPVIFFLRPGYPNPRDPGTQYEEARFRSQRWKVWNWRVMIEALQARGRNVRSSTDKGVTFFISQQFRRFVFGAMPRWLQPAYKGDKTFAQCVAEAKELLR